LRPHVVNRALRLANIPPWLKDKVFRDALDTGREITMRWYLIQCESHLQRERNLEPQIGGRVEDLYELIGAGRRFGTIYIDLPWPIPGVVLPYPTMTPEHMAALPIRQLANPERCHLHMWALPGRIKEIAYSLARHWGFRPVSEFSWCKPGGLGSGQYHRLMHEVCLTCVQAHHDRDRFDDHSLPSWGIFRRGRHSEKPDEYRKMIERASPPPRIELFARGETDGWVTWGYGIEKTPMEQQPDVPSHARYVSTPPEVLKPKKKKQRWKGRQRRRRRNRQAAKAAEARHRL
jgi:N6-adenosine-specific RNA methylase IME4